MSEQAIKVLLVEDDPADARLLQENLKDFKGASFEFTHHLLLKDGLSKLSDPEVDVVLLDLSLPDSTGFETFLRASEVAGRIPILVLSGYDDESVALRAVREGAQDYLVKGQVDSNLLGRAICYAIERKRTQEHIKESLAEKEVLLKEIHHRVKNNLQVICSLLSLQSRSVKDKALYEMFKESRNRIMSMALVHEELYRSRDFARIDFADYITQLVNNLLESYSIDASRVTSHLNLGPISLDIDKAIPCGLILNELVCNSLKHAFPHVEKGEIYVTLEKDEDNQIILQVQDNGRGLPPDFDWKRSRSLGLELVNTLVEQIEGEVRYSAEGRPTFRICFPGSPDGVENGENE